MTLTPKTIITACASALIMAACSTSSTQTTAADAQPDPRLGPEVRQVCFQQQIKNWRSDKSDRRAVIVQKGVREEYKLDLIGTCAPEDAFLSIGLVSRVGGGTCLTPGDRLVTDARYNDGDCLIHRIHEWREDAAKAAAK